MTWEEFRDIMLKKEKDGVKKYKVNGNNDGFIFRSSKTHGGQQFIFTNNRCIYIVNWCGPVLLFHSLTFDGMMKIFNEIK